jgi:SAM-dependent methyltransferase
MNYLISMLKRSINGFFGIFDLHLGRKHPPYIVGNARVRDSFPPYEELHRIGARENYFIHDGYRHRTEYRYYDDRSNSDDYQDEVYRFAEETADFYKLQTVVDIGCGSGYKLLKHLSHRNTIGLDVPDTYEALRRRHPDRKWAVSDFSGDVPTDVDLVVASDVIEHLLNPDELLDYIVRMNPRYIVLSTPDRNLMRLGLHNGPPGNQNHIREWSMAELHAFLSERFDILEHFHSNSAQWTQCVLARPKQI